MEHRNTKRSIHRSNAAKRIHLRSNAGRYISVSAGEIMNYLECYNQAHIVQDKADTVNNSQIKEKLRDLTDVWERLGYMQDPVRIPQYERQ